MNVIRLAVIGFGHWGPNHVRAFNALPGAAVRMVVDTSPDQRARVQQQFPDVVAVDDPGAAFDSQDIDAVVVATPTESHFALARDALRAGKHVLCEKPLCRTAAEGEELRRLATASGRVLMTGHVFLFNPGIVKLKALVDGREMGDLQYLAASRTNLGPIRSDVNAAYDLAAHDVSIFNWVLGAVPTTVMAQGAAFIQPGVEDVVFIALRYPGGVLAHIHASWLNPKKVRQITVVGSRRMVTWDDLALDAPLAVYDKGAVAEPEYGNYGEFLRVSMWEGDVRLPFVPREEPLKAQNRAFLEAIRALPAGAAFRSDAVFAVGVVRVLEAVGQSLAAGGAAVGVGEG